MKRALAAASTVLFGLAAGSTVAIAAGDGPPPPPPWVNSDGSVDESKIPDYAGAVDENGKVVKDKDGKPVKVKVDKGPPPLTPEQARARGKSKHEISRRELPDGVTIVIERPNVLAPGQN